MKRRGTVHSLNSTTAIRRFGSAFAGTVRTPLWFWRNLCISGSRYDLESARRLLGPRFPFLLTGQLLRRSADEIHERSDRFRVTNACVFSLHSRVASVPISNNNSRLRKCRAGPAQQKLELCRRHRADRNERYDIWLLVRLSLSSRTDPVPSPSGAPAPIWTCLWPTVARACIPGSPARARYIRRSFG